MSQTNISKKILSFQPFSLYENGGGGRLLRRLYENHEADVVSLIVAEHAINSKGGKIREELIYAYPIYKWWTKRQLRSFFLWLRVKMFYPLIARRVANLAGTIPHDILHVVNHGAFSAALIDISVSSGKTLWSSFHDHFSLVSPINDTRKLWLTANRRLVISDELGNEYQKLFGKLEYELITDGVHRHEIARTVSADNDTVTIYFAGLLHYEYQPLFQTLADALDSLSTKGYKFKLVIRGTNNIEFLRNRSFEIEFRNIFITDEEIKKELDEAQILYFPMMFNLPDFYLYSLSTKMVSYLGGSGTILYHGPSDSAACNLLQKSKAALCCTSLNKKELEEQILKGIEDKYQIFNNAKILAKSQFDMAEIQQRFWQEIDQNSAIV